MRTKKIFLNMVADIIPYLLIGVIGLVKMNVLINYIGDVGNGYYQTINQIISYVFLAQIGFPEAVIYSLYVRNHGCPDQSVLCSVRYEASADGICHIYHAVGPYAAHQRGSVLYAWLYS